MITTEDKTEGKTIYEKLGLEDGIGRKMKGANEAKAIRKNVHNKRRREIYTRRTKMKGM